MQYIELYTHNLTNFAGGSLCALGDFTKCEDYVDPKWYALIAVSAVVLVVLAILYWKLKKQRKLWLVVSIISLCVMLMSTTIVVATLVSGGAAKEKRHQQYEDCLANFEPGSIACEY